MMRKVILLAVLLLLPHALRAQLGEALNATNLIWTTSGTGGNTGWFVQSTNTYDGISAVASGSVTNSSQSSTLETTVTGPGTLSFWCSSPSVNVIRCYVNGTNQGTISHISGWVQKIIYVGPGTQTVQWVFSYTGERVENSAYLDRVAFTPGSTPPIMLRQPWGQSQIPGLNAKFGVLVTGTAPFAYQWQHEGTNIPGATAAAFTVTNVGPLELGSYRVIVSNSVDSVISSNALLEFGTVTAWGVISNETIPVTITNEASDILAIAAGTYHSLALRSNLSILASGYGSNGEMSIPSDLTNSIAIAAGTYHSAALNNDGTIAVWGSYGPADPTTNVPANLSNVVEVSVAEYHGVALKNDGTVIAWGDKFVGVTNVPPDLTNVVMVVAQGWHTLALKSDGTLVSWGFNPRTNIPPGLSNVVAIAAGLTHNVALKEDGTVLDWGDNSDGQTNVPPDLTNVIAISAGNSHSLALKADGTVVAWGRGPETNVPLGLTNVVEISTCGLLNLALVGNGPILHAPLSDAKMSNGVFSVSLPSQSGHVFALEYKESLADSNWTMLPLVAGTGRTLTLTDPTAAGHQRFYRVRRW